MYVQFLLSRNYIYRILYFIIYGNMIKFFVRRDFMEDVLYYRKWNNLY